MATAGETLLVTLVRHDIPGTPRRTRIARCLDDYGGRVQQHASRWSWTIGSLTIWLRI